MIIKNGKRIDGCSDTLPIGTVQPFLGLTPPKGYLLCQGQAVNKITYKELYEICGDTFGTSTETEFYLPDLRGKTIAGYNENDSTMNTLGALIGNATHKHTTGNHTLTIDEMPSHSHEADVSTSTGGEGSGSYGIQQRYSSTYTTAQVPALTATANWNGIKVTGGSQAHNHGDTGEASNYQPTIVMNWIVKAVMTIPVQSSLATSYTDSATDVYTCDYVNEAIRTGLGDNVPAGTVVDYNGEEIPEGWELADEYASVYIGPNEPTDGQDIWIQKGKNLFDIRKLTIETGGGITFTPKYADNLINASGTANSPYLYVLLPKFKPEHNFNIFLNGLQGTTQNILAGYTLYNADGSAIADFENKYSFDISSQEFAYIKVWLKRGSNITMNSDIQVLITYDNSNVYEPYIDKKVYLKNETGKYDLFVRNRVYVGPYQPEDGEEIWIQKGKNLIRSFRHDCMYHNGNSAYENSIYGFTATEPIDIELNVPYYFSHQLGVKNGNVNVIDANGVCLEQINPDDMLSPIIITNPNAKKIIINTWDINNQTSVNETWMQLEQGTGVTFYEPYIEKKVYIKNSNGIYETLQKDNDWEYARPNDEHTLFTVYTSWENLKEISIRTLGVESATFGYLTVPKEQWHNQGAYGLQVRCIDGNGYFQGYANFTVTEKGANYFKIAKSGTSTSTQILYKRK